MQKGRSRRCTGALRGAVARDQVVQSVDRALSIVETLAEDDDGCRLTDLAVRTGLSASTVHRLLVTLQGVDLCNSIGLRPNGILERAALRSVQHLQSDEILPRGRFLIFANFVI
jgi:hypothetical protein